MGKIFDALEKSKKERQPESKDKPKRTDRPATPPAEPVRHTKRTTAKNIPGDVDFGHIHTSLAGENTPRAPAGTSEKKADAKGSPKADPKPSEKPARPVGPPAADKPKSIEAGAQKTKQPVEPEKKAAVQTSKTKPPASTRTPVKAPAAPQKDAKVITIKREGLFPRQTTDAAKKVFIDPQKASRRQAASQKRKPVHQRLAESLLTFWKPQSLISEQFKKLRTNILFSARDIRARSILVSSATPNEGKSFVAANLAISIAQNINEHVLLIDCDLRKPSIHSLFGYDAPPGLSEYLSDNADIPSLLLKTQVHKLSILPSGHPPDNPSELLSSEKMKQFLIEARERYADRYLIIDTPPPQLSAESIAIANQVDGVLLVIESGGTDRELIEDTVDMFGRESVLGVVLNRSTATSKFLYGYAKKYKYDKPGGKPMKKNK